MTTFTNQDIADLLREVSAAYTAKDEDYFRIRAYENAASSIEHSTSSLYDLWKQEKLDDVPGIGSSIQQHLDELFRTGKVKHFDQVRKGLPAGMFALLNVSGIGAKTAYTLAKKLTLNDQKTAVTQLREAAQQGKIQKISGFGKTAEQRILRALEQGTGERQPHRLLLPEAETLAFDVIHYLKTSSSVLDCEVLGSLRRRVSTVGDIDIAVKTTQPEKVMEHVHKYPHLVRMLSTGEQTTMFLHKNGKEVDIKIQSPESWGSMLQHDTGSKLHNIHLRTLAKEKKFSLSEHGIKTEKGIKTFETEAAFYTFLGMDFIPPELREDAGEIEAAQKGTLPTVVQPEDIQGDLHIHTPIEIATSHDSGRSSVAQLLDKAVALGYSYIGFSDHNPRLSEMTTQERFKLVQKHHNTIDREVEEYVKKHHGKVPQVLKGIEVDIRTDGSLALEDESLALCDYVIASVHSALNQDVEDATQRILKAIKHPKVTIWGHPKGRMIQERDGLEYDWKTVFDACVKNKIIVEVNAWPHRLDLPDLLVRQAVDRGVQLMINTDTHAVEHMDLMRYGVWTAARGWAEAKDVVNTYSWEKFQSIIKAKQR